MNQNAAWAAGEMVPMLYDWAKIAGAGRLAASACSSVARDVYASEPEQARQRVTELMLEGLKLGDRENFTTRVYKQLREALMAGRFWPGQRLRIGELAVAMGVSQTPVREAIMQLVARGRTGDSLEPVDHGREPVAVALQGTARGSPAAGRAGDGEGDAADHLRRTGAARRHCTSDLIAAENSGDFETRDARPTSTFIS